jgi:hypothetical protein
MPVYLAFWQSRIYKLYVSSLHSSLFYGTSVPFVLDTFAYRSYLQKMQHADALDDFFSKYPSFSYNRNVSSTREFYRMRKQFNWVKNDRGEYPLESQAAWHSFRIAMVQTFNGTFGTDIEDLHARMRIGARLNIVPLPRNLHDLRQVIGSIRCCSCTYLEAIAGDTDACQPL